MRRSPRPSGGTGRSVAPGAKGEVFQSFQGSQAHRATPTARLDRMSNGWGGTAGRQRPGANECPRPMLETRWLCPAGRVVASTLSGLKMAPASSCPSVDGSEAAYRACGAAARTAGRGTAGPVGLPVAPARRDPRVRRRAHRRPSVIAENPRGCARRAAAVPVTASRNLPRVAPSEINPAAPNGAARSDKETGSSRKIP